MTDGWALASTDTSDFARSRWTSSTAFHCSRSRAAPSSAMSTPDANAASRHSVSWSSASRSSQLHISVVESAEWRGSGLVARSSSNRSASPATISSGVSMIERRAASSMASGRPSIRVHSSATVDLHWFGSRSTPDSAARWKNRSTAAPRSPVSSGRSSRTNSPCASSGSRLVARSFTSTQRAVSSVARLAAASTTCSQLSSTTRRGSGA